MTLEKYEKISEPFRKNPGRLKLLVAGDKLMTVIIFGAYPLLLCLMFFQKNSALLRCIFVPAISFIAVSFFRYGYSAKRPYEIFDMKPLIPKETKGKSFPSRHVFSVFMIGMTFFYINPFMGAAIGMIGILLGWVRVVGGVHFPKDVAAGALIGIGCGILGYYLPF